MKKLIVLLLIMSMLFSIVACDGTMETTTESLETTTEPIETSTKPVETSTKPGVTSTKPVETSTKPAETSTKPVETSTKPIETSQPVVVTTPKAPIVIVPSTNQDVEGYPEQIKSITSIEDDKVQFFYVEGGQGSYTADSLWVDIEDVNNLDAVDMMVLERNYRIYEDLGITIEAFTDPTLGISGLQSLAKIYFDVQDPGLDVYCGYQYFDIKVALTGNLYNLNTIVTEDDKQIIDVTKPYWATNFINSITYNDQMYWVTGDLALRYTGGLYCTFVNTDLYDQYVREQYDGKSIYDIVNEKNWKMQTMLDMAGLVNNGEQYGIVYEYNDCLDAFAFGSKIAFSKTNGHEDESLMTIYLHQNPDAVKLAGFLTTMMEAEYAHNVMNSDSEEMMRFFADGKALFAVNKLFMASEYLTEMEGYTIIPLPLLNEWQNEYGSAIHDSVTIFGISKFSNCPIAAAATLELMSYYSSLLVTPMYAASILAGTDEASHPEAVNMYAILRNNLDTDFAVAWSESINNISHVYRTYDNVRMFSSFVKVSSRAWPTRLKTLIEDLENAK